MASYWDLMPANTAPQAVPTFWDKLGQTWPAQIFRHALSAAMLPGDVYAGRVDPLSDDAIGRSTDLAGLAMLGTTGAPMGSLVSGFIRPKSGLPIPPQAVPADIKETISTPALNLGGKIYRGHNHSDALERAARELNLTFDQIVERFGGEKSFWEAEGFLTNNGRFVSRAGAAKIDEAATLKLMNPEIIDILKKYGWAGLGVPLGAPAATAPWFPQEQQQSM